MKWFQKLFKKKKKGVKETLKEVKQGDLVELRFKSPDQIGIVSGQELGYTRISRKEAEQRKVRGSVTHIRRHKEPLFATLIEITSFESPSMPGRMRRYTFLEDEIDEIRIL